MSEVVLAKRYLNAYANCLSTSEQKSGVEKLQSVLNDISKNHGLVSFLNDPVNDDDKKINLINKLIVDSSVLSNFLCVLVTRKRFNLVKQLLQIIPDKLLSLEGVVAADVYTSTSLNKDYLQEITAYLKAYFKKPVQIKEVIDETILGGIKIVSNNIIFDGTVENSLQEFKMSLN